MNQLKMWGLLDKDYLVSPRWVGAYYMQHLILEDWQSDID